MMQIHPTAIVSQKAELGSNIVIGPFSVIEDDVVIGNDCKIGPHVIIYNGARIGNRVNILQGAAVSNVSQDLKFDANIITQFIIDDDTTIREYVTLHRGTEDLGYSKVGKNCLLMAYTHVAHDCLIGDNCILANLVQIGGHATIEDNVIIGGGTPVHQFSKIGQHAMVAGGYRVIADVPPYALVGGEPLKYSGLNVIGLRRRGFSNNDIQTLKDAYKMLFLSGDNLSAAKIKVAEKYADHQLVKNILEFMEKSKRGLVKR
ncbi:MAG: acyl-ACP--UDP-N-acetylglucosamine O-acyltransferase [Melioribacteraceae bacterium]|nr:acyl-ACP--UDP-N-acetylglucosamine O-acyltransferase [Melioribacteraceae bacterium]